MFVERLLSAQLVATISLYMIYQTFCVKSPFHSNTCTVSVKRNVSRVISKTLIVGVWNFMSHSHFLKVWCGYIPDLWNMLPNIDSNFMPIFNSFFIKVEFRINGGYKLLFCLLGLLSCLRTACYYYSLASFCSSFYSAWWGETKGVNFCSFVIKFNQVFSQIFSQVYLTVSIWTSHVESRAGFSQGPLSSLELSKDSPKDKQDFNRF